MDGNKDIRLVNSRNGASTTTGNIYITNCRGLYVSDSGSIFGNKCHQLNIQTISGKIDLSDCKCNDITTKAGDIFLENCKVDTIKSRSGVVNLNGSIVNTLTAQKIDGNGDIKSLILCNKTTTKEIINPFNILDPKTWFSKREEKEITIQEDFYVPSNIRIKNIYTDGNVYSKYPINIIGNGKLILN